MGNSIRVGNLFGIPFFINPSWFIVFGLVTLFYSSDLSAMYQIGGVVPLLLGMVTALLMFGSVLLHELGHSAAAIRQGIEVKSITLFIFGGIASLGEESKTPGGAFWVAISGPMVSFVLFALFASVGLLTPISGPLAAIISLLAYINLVLGIFNLIPGLPLDGGNVLKSIVWKITGKPYKGVAFASRMGQVIGWLGIALGLNSVLGLSEQFGVSLIGSPWTILIGWFLLQNAGRSAQSAAVQEQLSDLTAADAIYEPSPVVNADLSLREFANSYIIGSTTNWKKYLVVDGDRHLLGEVEVEAIKTVPTMNWWDVPVRELMHPVELPKVQASELLIDVLPKLADETVHTIVVTTERDEVLGILERESVFDRLKSEDDEGSSGTIRLEEAIR
ncbi:MAG: site-2 protease family protein [Elainellaceae cyanobacterium]